MLSDGVKSLLENPIDDFQEAVTTLIRISGNILKNPTEEKFQSIRISSSAFQKKLLPHDGAVQCLIEMGFQENEDKFTFSFGNNLSEIETIHNQLLAAAHQRDVAHTATMAKPTSTKNLPQHREIENRLKSHFMHASIYENVGLQQKARNLIPYTRLKARASQRFASDSKNPNRSQEHLILLELLSWFKRDFFSWTDSPRCPTCNSPSTSSQGMFSASMDELRWGASRVEGYKCTSCMKMVRFPRYNHPEKLLQTRHGRCGEWANCFTLIGRSVGFEIRHVTDWSDHVWCEVFIPTWDRWVHCDPCENACDKPLLYEVGWRKQPSLVVAAAHDHVVDVTRRYAFDRDAMTSRRADMFDAAWLRDTIADLNVAARRNVNADRKRELDRRRVVEERELATVPTGDSATSGSYGGRTSGSLQWRVGRGETQSDAVARCDDAVVESGAIVPNDEELHQLHLRVEYSSANDEYKRVVSKDSICCWETLVFKAVNAQRKEELDWRMSYLCRREGTQTATCAWRVALPSTHEICDVTIRVESTAFDSGEVRWLVCSDRKSQLLISGEETRLTDGFAGTRQVSLYAHLRGGSGDCAWQKSQLFRQSLDQTGIPPFLIDLNMSKS